MIKAIIVDDESIARRSLSKLIERYVSEVQVVAQAENIQEAEKQIHQYKPDLIFLDIEMPTGNGFKLIEKFENPTFDVIFITAYDKYAIQAFNYATIDYLLKPIDVTKLTKSIERFKEKAAYKFQKERYEFLLQNINHPSNEFKKIIIPSRKGFQIINVADIIYCKASRSYCDIHLLSGEIIYSSKTLREMEETLPKQIFFRTHKSYLVNTNMCKSYESNDEQLKIITGELIPLSSRHKQEFIELVQSTL
jgi:two-component system LytT family response regulator